MKADPDTLAYLQLLETRVNDVMAKTSGGPGGLFYQQGGNSFGALGVLGTNDNNQLQIRANATTQIQLGDSTHGIAIGVPPNVSLGAAGTISLGCTGHLLGTSSAGAIDFQGGASSSFTTTAGTVTLTGAGGFSINGGAGSTIATSAGAIGVVPAGALTLTAGAGSIWSTTAGNLQVIGNGQLALDSSTSVCTLGNSTATAVTIGHSNINTTISGNGAPGGSFVQTFPLTVINNTAGNTNGGIAIQAGSNAGTGAIFIDMRRTDGTQVGNINQSGAAAMTYASGSDRRNKENIVRSARGLDLVKRIPIVEYTWRGDETQSRVHGLIAQDLFEVYPDAVVKGGENSKKNPWMVDYGRVSPLLIKSIQELAERLERLETSTVK